MNLTEKQHVDGIRAGDPTTFRLLFDEYYPVLTVFAQKYLDDPDQARETVQELFVNLYEKRETLNIQTSLKSYLYQSVRNSCFNRIKQDQTHRKHHQEMKRSAPEDTEWSDKMEEAELEEKIFRIISGLPPKCKEIFLLSRQEDLTNKEIAEKLEISPRTVETQISKALKVLREKLN